MRTKNGVALAALQNFRKPFYICFYCAIIIYIERMPKRSPMKEPIRQALLSIDKMIQGGIYDQLGGGFARYSTDDEWLAPHFEKMLYDNALLLMVISEAYQLTGERRYTEVIDETMEFIQREMT